MKLLQLTPNLMVNDVAESTKFYSDLFGFEIQYMVRKGGESDTGFDTEPKSGVVYQYAGLMQEGFRLGLQEKESILVDVKEITTEIAGTLSGNLYFEVEDLEEFKSKLNGIEFRELETTWYGMKEVYLKDLNGYVICVSQKDPNFVM